MSTKVVATRRVLIVGGGISGLAASWKLAEAGVPVTLLEASELGSAASTRNQGWLHSGAIYALESPEYARACYASLLQTLAFSPGCVEPQVPSMVYLFSRPDAPLQRWTSAWESAGIPFREVPVSEVYGQLPGLARGRIQHAFELPDRAIRPDVLLTELAATAQNSGVEIRTGAHVARLLVDGPRCGGVVTSAGEEIRAQLVILAGGSRGFDLCEEFAGSHPGSQPDVECVRLKRHLVALDQEVGRLPFCIVDALGLDHIPHPPSSVFGVEAWETVRAEDDRAEASRAEQILALIREFFPKQALGAENIRVWAGTIMQALRLDQIEPGKLLWPAVVDHAQGSAGLANAISIFAGRATLWSQVAEQARKLVLTKLEQTTKTTTAAPPWTTP